MADEPVGGGADEPDDGTGGTGGAGGAGGDGRGNRPGGTDGGGAGSGGGGDDNGGGGNGGDDAPDTREAIMLATYRVLREHGYQGLSVSRIAEAADLTKAALYHHFDGKHELMLAFLEYMLDHFRAEFQVDPAADPHAALDTYLDAAFEGPGEAFRGPRGDRIRGQGAYVELRTQAVHDEGYRERFSRIDGAFAAQLATVVRAGVESGAFRRVDPDRAAAVLLTLSLGAIFRRQTADAAALEDARAAVDEWVDAWLVADGD